MQACQSSARRFLRRAGLSFAAAMLLALSGGAAFAQTIVAKVNGTVISSYDVDQRMRIQRAFGGKAISRPQAIQELIDDRLKIQEGRRIGFKISEDDIDGQMTRMAANYRQSKEQLEAMLRARGIDVTAFREKILADSMWSSLIPYKARTLAPSNDEINQEIQKRVQEGKARITDYELNQVIFVVPGASPGLVGPRQRDAAAARGRFKDCESGLAMLRDLRDVAVRPPVYRSSSELPKPMNDMLQKTPVGHLTEPYRSDQGIEMLAVCNKSERTDESVVRTEVESDLRKKMAENLSESVLKDLRAKAVIER